MDQAVHLGITGIKEVAFEIDETIELPGATEVGINFEQSLNPNMEQSTVELILTVRLFKKSEPEKNFLRIKTSNIFFVQELKNFATETVDEYNFPDILLATILGLSISHTRALLAKCTLGTKFDGFFIPIVNPGEVAKQLFLTSINNTIEQ